MNIELINDISSNIVSNIIAKVFASKEPMSKHLLLSENIIYKWVNNLLINCMPDGLSYCMTSNNIINGCIISENFSNENTFFLYEMQPIVKIFKKLYEYLPNYITNGQHKVLHIYICATLVESNNSGICYKLCEYTLKKAKELGYEYIIVELTSPITQYIFCDKLGFSNIYEIRYNDYGAEFLNCAGKIILGIKRI